MKSDIYRQTSKKKEHKKINIIKKWKLFCSRDVEIMREIKSLTGVEWETQNTFDPTVKNAPRLIKFSFENEVYNHFILKRSLYNHKFEDEINNLSLNSIKREAK
jgi:hypothetical protein